MSRMGIRAFSLRVVVPVVLLLTILPARSDGQLRFRNVSITLGMSWSSASTALQQFATIESAGLTDDGKATIWQIEPKNQKEDHWDGYVSVQNDRIFYASKSHQAIEARGLDAQAAQTQAIMAALASLRENTRGAPCVIREGAESHHEAGRQYAYIEVACGPTLSVQIGVSHRAGLSVGLVNEELRAPRRGSGTDAKPEGRRP